MPRVGHFGLVPRHPTWIGGLRAYCKTVEEALRLYQGVNPLELAGAFAVETECVPAEVQTETSRRTMPDRLFDRLGLEAATFRALKHRGATNAFRSFPRAPLSTIAVNPDKRDRFRDKLERAGLMPMRKVELIR